MTTDRILQRRFKQDLGELQATMSGATSTTELEKLRSLRRWVFGLFLGFIPFALFSSLILEALGLSPLWAIGPYGLAYGLLSLWLGYAPCPRCGKLFYKRAGFISPFWAKCGSCGLELPD